MSEEGLDFSSFLCTFREFDYSAHQLLSEADYCKRNGVHIALAVLYKDCAIAPARNINIDLVNIDLPSP